MWRNQQHANRWGHMLVVQGVIKLSHRPPMTLSEYYAKCARCPFKDMRDECKRAQDLRSMTCYIPTHQHNHISASDYIREMLEEDRELLVMGEWCL